MNEQIAEQEQQTQENSTQSDFQEDEFSSVLPEDTPDQEIEETGEEPEISIQDGEVNFRDDFFGDVPDKTGEENASQPSNVQKQVPNYYTDEELQNIPADQWDKSRMPDDVRRYYEAFQNQIAAYERQQEIQQRAQTPPSFLTQPKQLTPKELNDEAMKVAVERLGLKSDDDYDVYDDEHRAALDIARQEILQRNATETADYQRKAGEYQNWVNFSRLLISQPDFNEFKNWYLGEVQKSGNTPEQIDEGLKRVAQTQGFGAVQGIWTEFYRQFRASKAQSQNKPVSRPRAKMPAPLESTRGGNNDGKRIVNMKDFGNLDEDAQVQALMDMGIV